MTRWSSRVVFVLGLWLGASLVPSVGLAAPSEGSEPPKVDKGTTSMRVPGLAVWVEPTVPEGERIGGWVEERGAQVLRQHQPPLEPQDLVRVAVRGGPYDYQIHIALLRDKHLLPDQPAVIVCECKSDEMLNRVGEAIDAGARRLTDTAAAEREAAEQAKAEEDAQLRVPVDTGKKRQRLGAMGYVGIGLSVVGVGLVAAGIPLALRPDELRGEPGTLSLYSTRPPGVGSAIGGGVGLATGVTLLVVDLVRHRKSRVAILPTVGTRHAWLWIIRAF